MAYIGNDVDAIFIPESINTSTSLRISGGGVTQTGGDVNFDSGTLFVDEDTNRVGILTITPGYTLDVNGSVNVPAATNLLINGTQISTADLTENASYLFYTDARSRAAISVTDSGGDGSLAYDSNTGVITYTGPSAAEARAHFSVTDSGGDGSLSYDSGTGVFTYTGPSASETRAHFSGGTGITLSSGTISIDGTDTNVLGGSLDGSLGAVTMAYLASAPNSPVQGQFYFNSLDQKAQIYTGSSFVDLVPSGSGGSGGAGTTDANATFRKYTYTLTSTTNAVSGSSDTVVSDGNFVVGNVYTIKTVGTTDFTAIGASANTVGVVFTATGNSDPAGTGDAYDTLYYATGGNQNVEVYVNGVKAVEGSSNDYVATTGTSVNFVSNLASGDVVDVQVYELLTQDAFVLATGGTFTGNVGINTSTINNRLHIHNTANDQGILLTQDGSNYSSITGNANRTGADESIIDLRAKWNGTLVSAISLESGDDTTNKDDGRINFWTSAAGGTLENRLSILPNGNVGFGTGDPLEKLDILGGIKIKSASNAYESNYARIFHNASSTADFGINLRHVYGVTGNYDANIAVGGGGTTRGEIRFYTGTGVSANAPETLRITAEGTVAISSQGYTDGISKLTIRPDDRTTSFDASNGATWHDVVIRQQGIATDNAVGIAFELPTDSGYHVNAGTGIAAVKNGINSDYGSDLVFITRPQSAVAEERLRITSDGHLKMPSGAFDLRVGDNTNSNAGTQTISVGSINSGSSGGLQLWANPTNGNSYVQFGDGSAAADQYRGWMNYQHETDNLNFGTSNQERLRIDSAGNVGIGTDNPGAKLDVYQGEVQIRSSAAYNTHLNYQNTGSHYITVANDGATIFRGSSNGITAAIIYGGGTTQFNGNVGIGTDNPTFGQSTPISTYDPKFGIQGSILIGNLSTTASDRYELQFYRRNGAAGQPIDTHDMGRIAWYGSNNDGNNGSLAWSIGVNPDGGGWTSGANRKGYMTFNNHNGELIRITSSGVIRHGTNLYSGSYTGEKIVIAAEPTAGDTSTVVIGEEYAGSANPSISLFRRDGSTFYSGYGYRISNFVGKLNFSYASTALPGNHSFNPKVTFDQSGNVGIGTDNPSSKLDVRGKLYVNTANSSNAYPIYQVETGKKAFSTTSGAWTDIAKVGHSHALELTYMVLQNENYAYGGVHGTSLINTAYGNSSGEQVLHKNVASMNGGQIQGLEWRYLNTGGSTSYILQARVTFSGTSLGTFTMGYSIKGHASEGIAIL